MEIIIISVILCLCITGGFYLLNPKKYLWWEFIVPPIITLISAIIINAIVIKSNVTFTEYWGETIIELHESEPWNEWISKTCSREVATGTDSKGNTTYRTEYYDCSYQDDHGPSWLVKTNLGNEYYISEKYHDELVKLYSTKRTTIKTRKNYSSTSRSTNSKGTKFEGTRVGKESYIISTKWPQKEESRRGVFSSHSYENRIRASDLSVFNIKVISNELADSLGLYKYPYIINKFDFPTILGLKVSDKTDKLYQGLNAKYGPTHKLRLWILFFTNKPMSYAIAQENYWTKGNKNELVVCIGINSNKEVQWSHAFSWALSSELTAKVAQKVLSLYEIKVDIIDETGISVIPVPKELFELKDSLIQWHKKFPNGICVDDNRLSSIIALPIYTPNNAIIKIQKSNYPIINDNTLLDYYKFLDKELIRFQKRSFKEFSYLNIELKGWQVWLIIIIAIVSSILTNIWAIKNHFNDEN